MGATRRHSNTVINQAANLNLHRVVLYKRGHFIESANSFFIIEISSDSEGGLIIAAYDIQTGASMMMHKKPEIARRTLQQFNNDMQAVAESV